MKLATLAAAAVLLATGITQRGSDARPHQQIFIPQSYTAPFDAQPGDTVNLIIDPTSDDPLNYCNQRGGTLRMNPYTQIIICENIDF